MDVDQAMLLMARALDSDGVMDRDLTDQVRERLLTALAGPDVLGLPDEAAAALHSWLAGVRTEGDDPSGTLYQQMLQRVLVRTDDGTWHVVRQREGHRRVGAYYTDQAVVRYMLNRVQKSLPTATSLIDPACGTGAFLMGAERSQRFSRMVGLDTDPLALRSCQSNAPRAELHQGDALLAPFPGGFDVCIGNPPYISSGLRGAVRLGSEQAQALRARFPQSAEYKLNSYPLFVERGLELLCEGGVLAYILPDSFLSGRYFSGLRRLLLQHKLLELTLIREDFWRHGRVGQSVILLVQKGAAPPNHKVTVRVCNRVQDLPRASGTTGALPLSEIVWGEQARFRLLPDRRTRTFVHQMEAVPGSRPLGSLLRSYSGLIGRGGQRSLLRSENPGFSGPLGRLLRSGREIDRYRIEWSGEDVCLDSGLIKSGGHLPYYRNPKLLLRQTADAPRVVLDEDGFFCLNNIHLLIPVIPTTNLSALLGLLNSEPIARYYRALTMEAGRLYPQVDLDVLEAIPIPPIPNGFEKQLALLATARAKAAPVEAAALELELDKTVTRLYRVTTQRPLVR